MTITKQQVDAWTQETDDLRSAIGRLRSERDEWRDLARRLAKIVAVADRMAGGITQDITLPDGTTTSYYHARCRSDFAVTDDEIARAATPDADGGER